MEYYIAFYTILGMTLRCKVRTQSEVLVRVYNTAALIYIHTYYMLAVSNIHDCLLAA